MTSKSFAAAAAALLLMATSTEAGPASLSLENYEAEMGGKNSFVKFLAPWWGHCKSMAPAWEQLADEFAGSSSVLIADADCTAEGDKLCEQFEIRGYPTIKYFVDGDMSEGQDYQGGRDFDSLKEFVADKLEVKCFVSDPSTGCTEKQQKYIEKMAGKSSEDRAKQLTRLDGMKGDAMKSDLKSWLIQRIAILKQFEEAAKEEL